MRDELKLEGLGQPTLIGLVWHVWRSRRYKFCLAPNSIESANGDPRLCRVWSHSACKPRLGVCKCPS